MNQYAERNIDELDMDGDYYRRHVSAMTGEGLHSKNAIAAELAHRDREIDRLRNELVGARELVEHWGCYASAYFQEKHDLAGDLVRLDAAVSNAKLTG